MKKVFSVLLALGLLLSAMAGCAPEAPAGGGEVYTVSLDQSKVTLDVYGRTVLTAVVKNSAGEPVEQPIIWASSDPGVAAVNGGAVSALKAGEVTVTATLPGGASASCTVVCQDNGILPRLELANMTDGSLTLAAGQSFHLEPLVSFAGRTATDSDTVFTFSAVNGDVVSVSGDGVITALAEGATQIVITAQWRGLGGEGLQGGEAAYGLRIVLEISVVKL